MQTAVWFCPVPTDNNHKQGSIKQFSLEEQTLTGSARIDTKRNQLVSSGFLISLFFFLSFVLLPSRVRERKTRDFNQVKCIKDEREHLLVKEDEIRHRWQEYFDKLFNGENMDTTFQLDDSFDDTNRRFVRRIQESEVREALKRMKGGKAMGPDGIPIEVWRCLGDIVICNTLGVTL